MASKKLTLIAVAVLVCALGWFAAAREFGAKPGITARGTTASVQNEYADEESWIVNEVTRDIAEMSAYAVNPASAATVVRATSVGPGLYRVSAPGLLKQELSLDLSSRVWDVEKFATVASTILRAMPRPVDGPVVDIHQRLEELTPAALTSASAEISAMLSDHMDDAKLHESAALVIGAFGLRESARRFNDVRWSLNRMTAHLAVAYALSGAAPRELDGMLASATLLTLAGHQTDAMGVIVQVESGPFAQAAAPWTRALRLRLTQNWRAMPAPVTGSLLEKLEYFRARREAGGWTRAQVDLDALRVDVTDAADWIRIVEADGLGVEEGHLLGDTSLGLHLERDEVTEVSSAFPAGAGPLDANARATRCITNGRPQVISWGAWAEFSQRHVAMLVHTVDWFWRHYYGQKSTADIVARQMDGEFSSLTMYPAATLFRTKGVAGGDIDATRINEAIATALATPERMTAEVWSWIDYSQHYSPIPESISSKVIWFQAPSPRMPYEAAKRLKAGGHTLTAEQLAALLKEASFDFEVEQALLSARLPKPTRDDIQQVFGDRMHYDLRALGDAVERLPDDEGRRPLLRQECDLNASRCTTLALTLESENPAQAAALYEKAFADPSYDVVSRSGDSRWLVDYYYEHGNTTEALALAGESAEVGSQRGLVTAGRLYERLGRFQEAEGFYRSIFERYKDQAALLGFYYRAINVRKQSDARQAWDALTPVVFPKGPEEAPTSMTGRPEHGVVITKDYDGVKKAGLQTNDIIMGVDGVKVENLKQYYAANAFFTGEKMTLTVWRGHLFTVTLVQRLRRLDADLRSYPVLGWAE